MVSRTSHRLIPSTPTTYCRPMLGTHEACSTIWKPAAAVIERAEHARARRRTSERDEQREPPRGRGRRISRPPSTIASAPTSGKKIRTLSRCPLIRAPRRTRARAPRRGTARARTCGRTPSGAACRPTAARFTSAADAVHGAVDTAPSTTSAVSRANAFAGCDDHHVVGAVDVPAVLGARSPSARAARGTRPSRPGPSRRSTRRARARRGRPRPRSPSAPGRQARAEPDAPDDRLEQPA